MDDGLIGLIILIAVLNIVGRIIRGFSRAAQQRKQAPGQGPGLAGILEKLQAASEAEKETTEAVDEGPFSWLREEAEQDVLPPAQAKIAREGEFLEHPEVEYVLDDRLVVEPVPVYTGEAIFESVPGMPLETPFERPDLTAPAIVETRPRGLEALVDNRFTGLRRAVVYSEILQPCIAARKIPSMRRYA